MAWSRDSAGSRSASLVVDPRLPQQPAERTGDVLVVSENRACFTYAMMMIRHRHRRGPRTRRRLGSGACRVRARIERFAAAAAAAPPSGLAAARRRAARTASLTRAGRAHRHGKSLPRPRESLEGGGDRQIGVGRGCAGPGEADLSADRRRASASRCLGRGPRRRRGERRRLPACYEAKGGDDASR